MQQNRTGKGAQQQARKRQLGGVGDMDRPEMRREMMTPRIKNDLIGIVVLLVAVILMVAAVVPGDAVLTSWLSSSMRGGFGLGVYVLPVEVAAFGACFFFLGRHDIVLPRVAIGLVMIFVAIISLIGVSASGVVGDLRALLDGEVARALGGWLGNGIAYGLLSFVGPIVSWVVLLAVIIAGFVLIGFSISGMIDRISEVREHGRRDRIDLESEPERTEIPISPYARARIRQMDSNLVAADASWTDGGTRVLDRADPGSPEDLVPATQMLGKNGQAGAGLGFAGETRVLGQTGSSGSSITRMFDPDDGSGASSDAAGMPFEPMSEMKMKTIEIPDFLKGSRTDDAAAAVVAGGVAGGSPEAFLGDEDGSDDASDRDEPSGAASGGKRSSGGKSRKKVAAAEGESADTVLGDGGSKEDEFRLPSFDMLRKSGQTRRTSSTDSELAELAAKLQDTLCEFNVDGEVVGWVHGPTVTLFKVSLASGVRVNRITALADDIGLAFASSSVRIFSPIAGTSLVGIEIPNDSRDNVLLGDVLPPAGGRPMLLGIGKDVEGNPITADLARMPHLLIGGTTGSGKSVSINSMIMSVLMRATPGEVRMILIDPKRVELSFYNDIPHLFVPVVTDPHKAAATLGWAVTEMDRRLRLFEEVGARNLSQYGKLRDAHDAEVARRARIREEARQRAMEEARRKQEESDLEAVLEADGKKEAADVEDPGAGEAVSVEEIDFEWEDPFEGDDFDDEEWEDIPSIMIVIDELADLMMVAGKDVEASISRIAQLARAAGIHLIVATQRPSTNVITGLIKANITNRIAFNVASGIDSRVILDVTGAEHLVGLGDMLFSKPEFGKPVRVQGCYVGEDEIHDVCNFWKAQAKPDYHEDIFTTQTMPVLDSGGGLSYGGGGGDDDLLWQAAEIVVGSNLGSTSALQRRLKVGYARAGRIMDMLEDKGIVGPANGSKPREVYVEDLVELENMRALSDNGML